MKKNENVSQLEIIKNIGFIIKFLFQTNRMLYYIRFPLLLLKTLSSITNIYLFGHLVNELSVSRNVTNIVMSITFLCIANFLISLVQRILLKHDMIEQEKTLLKIKYNLGSVISQMQLSDIEQPRLKDFVSLAQQSDSFSNILDALTNLLNSIIQIITYCLIIFTVQPLIAIFIISNMIVQLIINKFKLNLENKWRLKQEPFLRKLWYYEGLLCDPRYGKEIRVNLLKNWILKKTNMTYEKECAPIVKANAIEVNRFDFFVQLLRIIENIVIYTFLAYKVIHSYMKIGDFSFYLASTTKLTTALFNFSNSIFSLNKCGLFAKEFRFCMEFSNKKDCVVGHKKHCNSDFSIEFKNVSFKYPNTDNLILKDISFRVNSGEKLSLVGVNGSGKSTLVKLICRFYKPTEGEIYLGGINIEEFDADEYSKLLGVVFQDYKLFSFSVIENITMGEEKYFDRFEYSIKNSGLKDKIDSLPAKENTYIYKDFDERGVEFSGGEGQKLTIGRVLYKNPPIIILDEPTAALDPIAEYEMYKNFADITNNKTTVYISHRLSSTRFADKIAVLKGGMLCEFGNHNELLKKGGVYAEMYQIQAKWYEQ